MAAISSPPPVAVTVSAPLPAERADAAWTTPPLPATIPPRPPLPVTAIHRYASGGTTAGDPDPVQLLQSGGGEKHSARKGNLMHAVFAGMAPARACALHGFSADDAYLSVCAAAYQEFCCHPLIRESTCQQCEVKFVHRFGNVQVRGAIDRIVRRADGQYVVIDYKTGSDPGDGSCRKEYLIQLAVYADAVRALTGAVPDTFLYYTRTGRMANVIPDIAAARAVAAQAAAAQAEAEAEIRRRQ